ncbi:MAG: hypothetical protein ACFFBD_30090, partial [Candidatus Hodarchaeota archaeon]
CIYSIENADLDYREQVLNCLIVYLSNQGYEKIQVIAGRRTAYPNGPTPLFIANGFREVSVIDKIALKLGMEELVLLEKKLSSEES